MAVNRRSELERLLDLTVLGPTDPQLGTCWQFTGTYTPYGRIAEPVTQSHVRKTHCKHGHLLSGDNLRIGPNGVRPAGHATPQPSGRSASANAPQWNP
jgi:hypothetical protein